MANKKGPLVNAAKAALEEFKVEIANEAGVGILDTTKPEQTTLGEVKERAFNNMAYGPRIGGEMVKQMIKNAENQMAEK